MPMLASNVRWDTVAIRSMLTRVVEGQDAEIQVARLLDHDGRHLDGVRSTLSWVLGEAASPMFGVTDVDEVSLSREWLTVRRMVEDDQYGRHSPTYVLAVYRTMDWLRAGAEGEHLVIDPLTIV